jgi:hypothetical protein
MFAKNDGHGQSEIAWNINMPEGLHRYLDEDVGCRFATTLYYSFASSYSGYAKKETMQVPHTITDGDRNWSGQWVLQPDLERRWLTSSWIQSP